MTARHHLIDLSYQPTLLICVGYSYQISINEKPSTKFEVVVWAISQHLYGSSLGGIHFINIRSLCSKVITIVLLRTTTRQS